MSIFRRMILVEAAFPSAYQSDMLARMSVQNFLSVDGEIELSLLAAKESRHVGRVAGGRELPARILQTAAVWGANASGKSNFTKIFAFAQYLVVHGTRPDRPTGRTPFRLRPEAANEPSIFEFDIIVEFDGAERLFRYRFGVTNRDVTEESLVEIRPVTPRIYFTRRLSPESDESNFTLDWWERRQVSDEDRMFARVLAKATRRNQLFLHEAMDRNLTLLAPIFRWFRDQLVILDPNADLLALDAIEVERQDLRDFVGMMLNRADTGVISIAAEEVPIESTGIPQSLIDELQSNLKEGGSGLLLRLPNRRRYSLYVKDGRLTASRILMYRSSAGGDPVAFESSEESDGTLRLFDLSPLFHELSSARSKKVYIIDELDRSMHTQLTAALVQMFLDSRSPETRAQLLFTTHDVQLISQELFRRDEMWFLDKGLYGQMCLERLSRFRDVRYDKDVRKAYLEGKFSGTPKLRPFEQRIQRRSTEIFRPQQ